MKWLIGRLWSDDAGAVIATELLFVGTTLIIGTITGMVSLRQAINSEFKQTGEAILALSQSYSFDGTQGCCSQTQGSVVFDVPTNLPQPTCFENGVVNSVDVVTADGSLLDVSALTLDTVVIRAVP